MFNGNLRPICAPLFQGTLFLADFFFCFKANTFLACDYADYARLRQGQENGGVLQGGK